MEARRIQQATAQEARPVYTDGAAEMSPFGAEFHALIQSLIGGAGANPMLDLSLIPTATLAAPVEAKAEVVEEEPVEQEVEEEIEADVEAEVMTEGEEESASPEELIVAVETAAAAVAPVKAEVVEAVAEVVEVAEELATLKTDYTPQTLTPAAVDAVEVQPLLVQQQALNQEQVVKQAAPQQVVAAQQTELAKNEGPERQTLAQLAPEQLLPEAPVEAKPVEGPKVETKAPLSPFIRALNGDAGPEAAAALTDAASPQLAMTDGVAQSAQQSIHKNATGMAGAQTTLAELQLRSQSALAGSAESLTQSGNGKGSAEGIALLQAQTERGGASKGKAAATGLPRSDQEKILQQIREVMKKATMSADGNTMVVRLDPPELGNITVRVTQRDGQVFARVIPENPDVEQMLRQRAGEVTQALAAVGLKADHVQLSIGRERSESETFRFQEQHGSGGGNQTGEQGSSSSGSERGDRSDTSPRNKGPKSGLAADTAEVGWVA